MATARRIALVLVIVLLICDGALLALVKMNGPKSGGSFNLLAQEEKADKANKVKAALEKEGFTPSLSEGTKKNRLNDGLRVVLHSSKSVVDPLYQDLTHNRFSVKKVDDGKALQIKQIFKSKKLAQQEADKLSKYGFKVEDNFKEVEVKCTRIALNNLDSEKADKAEKIFQENKVPVTREAATPGASGTP